MDALKKAQFLSLYCMAVADGTLSAEELACLYGIAKNSFNLSDKDIVSSLLEQGTTFVLPDTMEGKVRFLYHMGEVAWADGKVVDSERSLLAKYARAMGFDARNIDEIVDFMLQQVKARTPLEEVVSSILSD